MILYKINNKLSLLLIFSHINMWYCKHYKILWASTEVFVDWRKQKAIWWCFCFFVLFCFFCRFCDCLSVYTQMIIDFKDFLFAFPWWPHGPDQGTSKSQRCGKVYFPLFWWWVLSKTRLWKINHCVNHAVPVSLFI